MIKNLNDVYREKILEDDSLDKLNMWELNYILDILISDMYKIFLFQNRKEALKIIEQKYVAIKKQLIFDKELFKKAYDSTYRFFDMELINRSIIMEDLKNSDKDFFLTSKNKLNILDMISYSFKYELDYFVEVYDDFIKKNPKEDKLIIEYIIDSINELKIINYEKYEKYILEFLKVYYKHLIYNKEIESDNPFYKYILNNTLKDLFNNVETDNKFFYTILENYLSFKLNSEEIQQKIEEDFKKNADEEIQKKLRFKKDNDKKS